MVNCCKCSHLVWIRKHELTCAFETFRIRSVNPVTLASDGRHPAWKFKEKTDFFSLHPTLHRRASTISFFPLLPRSLLNAHIYQFPINHDVLVESDFGTILPTLILPRSHKATPTTLFSPPHLEPTLPQFTNRTELRVVPASTCRSLLGLLCHLSRGTGTISAKCRRMHTPCWALACVPKNYMED